MPASPVGVGPRRAALKAPLNGRESTTTGSAKSVMLPSPLAVSPVCWDSFGFMLAANWVDDLMAPSSMTSPWM